MFWNYVEFGICLKKKKRHCLALKYFPMDVLMGGVIVLLITLVVGPKLLVCASDADNYSHHSSVPWRCL